MREDKSEQLRAYSMAELIAELKRRKQELESGIALLAESRDSTVRNSRMSAAKAAYWRDWHEYKAAHPEATVEQWRRAQKRSKK